MIDNLTFLRLEWLWVVMVWAVLLWALFLWKEYSQMGVKRLLLKAIIALVAVGALAIMLLQPLLPEERVTGVGAIRTQNYKKSQLDSLKAVHPGLSVISYAGDGFEKAQLDAIGKGYVLGDGVAPHDFWQLENIEASYVGGSEINGVVRLRYDQEPIVGDSLKVQGLYAKPTIGNRLVLEDASGNGLDSIAISKSEDLNFRLETKLKVAGLFVFRLVEKDRLNTLISVHPLPMHVQSRNALRILIINTFPTFETKYLKNFLAEDGHEVLVRSQLTKNTYKFENFNRKQASIYGFTRSNLDDFDLLIIDSGSFLGLSTASKRAMEQQMENEGLGVFIQPDVTLARDGKRFGFRFKRNTTTETRLPQWPEVKIPVFAASFEWDALVQPILSSERTVLSGYTQKGAGRQGTSMLADTYQLVLDGNEGVYQYIWSTMLSTVSQKKLPIVEWEAEKYIAYQDEPWHFKLRTLLPNPEVIAGENNQIAVRQNLQLRDQWEGVVYPRKVGWNRLQLKLKQDSIAQMHYYVGEDNDWKDLKRFDSKQENARVFNKSVAAQAAALTLQPIPRIWFLLVFSLAMGYLWLVPRIDRG